MEVSIMNDCQFPGLEVGDLYLLNQSRVSLVEQSESRVSLYLFLHRDRENLVQQCKRHFS